MVQWLILQASNARGSGSISDQGTKIPHAMQGGQENKKGNKKKGKKANETMSHRLGETICKPNI